MAQRNVLQRPHGQNSQSVSFSSLPLNPECNNTRIFVVNKKVIAHQVHGLEFDRNRVFGSKANRELNPTPFVPLSSNFRHSTEAAHRLDVDAKEHRLNRQIVDLFAPFCQRI